MVQAVTASIYFLEFLLSAYPSPRTVSPSLRPRLARNECWGHEHVIILSATRRWTGWLFGPMCHQLNSAGSAWGWCQEVVSQSANSVIKISWACGCRVNVDVSICFLFGTVGPTLCLSSSWEPYELRHLIWLVVYLPLWKIWKSIGVMTFPTEWKFIKVMFQSTNQI